MSVKSLLTDWACPACGEGPTLMEIKNKYAKTAPKWKGWPVPPPTSEFDEHILIGADIMIRCANGHQFTYFEYAEMKVNDD